MEPESLRYCRTGREDGLRNTDPDLQAPFQTAVKPWYFTRGISPTLIWPPYEKGRLTPVRSCPELHQGGFRVEARVHPNASCPHCGGDDAPRKTVFFSGEWREIPFTFCQECVPGKRVWRSVLSGTGFNGEIWFNQQRKTGWPPPVKPEPVGVQVSWWRGIVKRWVGC